MSILQDHADAFLNLLEADDVAPALAVLDGGVPRGRTPPYVVLYLSFEAPDGTQAPGEATFDAGSDIVIARATVHSVGVDARAARSVAGRVRARLLDVTPVITGRVCYPIRHEAGQPVTRDESTGVPVYDQVDQYRLKTIPV